MRMGWYLSVRRDAGGFRFRIFEMPELKGVVRYDERPVSIEAVGDLLRSLEPYRLAHLEAKERGGEPLVVPDDTPPGETAQDRVRLMIERLQGPAGSAAAVLAPRSFDDVDAILMDWRSRWQPRRG